MMTFKSKSLRNLQYKKVSATSTPNPIRTRTLVKIPWGTNGWDWQVRQNLALWVGIGFLQIFLADFKGKNRSTRIHQKSNLWKIVSKKVRFAKIHQLVFCDTKGMAACPNQIRSLWTRTLGRNLTGLLSNCGARRARKNRKSLANRPWTWIKYSDEMLALQPSDWKLPQGLVFTRKGWMILH